MLTDSQLTETQILEEVKQIIAENLGIQPDQIQAAHSLENDLGCDSLDVVEIAMGVEEHFDISVPDSQASAANTVADIAAGVTALLK